MELPIVYLRYIILQLMFALLRHVKLTAKLARTHLQCYLKQLVSDMISSSLYLASLSIAQTSLPSLTVLVPQLPEILLKLYEIGSVCWQPQHMPLIQTFLRQREVNL